ncbi:hypothetical protein BDN70DRAFT_617255 [Pholiota conissans]|uniref:Uncharacterized protein n=1 Tax=Pholiota conissans TaxID=109636 RepID=A0A9P5YNS7_9AGAR|nr:hypothetical protein BDN70DRAFT_617255 [Pholiota conissans]
MTISSTLSIVHASLSLFLFLDGSKRPSFITLFKTSTKSSEQINALFMGNNRLYFAMSPCYNLYDIVHKSL